MLLPQLGSLAVEGVRTHGLLLASACGILVDPLGLRLLISKMGTHKDSYVSGVGHDKAGQ